LKPFAVEDTESIRRRGHRVDSPSRTPSRFAVEDTESIRRREHRGDPPSRTRNGSPGLRATVPAIPRAAIGS